MARHLSVTPRRKRLLASASVAVLAVAGTAVLSTGALFTDQATVGTNTFTAGTVDLTATPTSQAFSVSNMAPGDTVTKPVSVKNSGSLQLRYALTSSATGDLAPALRMQVKTGVTDCTNTGFATGSSLYGVAGVGTPQPVKVFGDARQGPDAGDRVLTPGSSETLCVQVTLPGPTTGNAYQGTSANLTLTFNAEQTKNNGSDVPAAPQTVAATPAPIGVNVTWGPSTAAGVTGYQVVRSADRGSTWTTLATVGPDVRSYNDTSGTPGTAYVYDVLTITSGGTTSPPTTTEAPVDYPTPPGTKTVVATGMGNAFGVVQATDGTFFIMEPDNTGRLYKVTTSGAVSTIATSQGYTLGGTLGRDGNLYFTDFSQGQLVRITTQGLSRTVIGSGMALAWDVITGTDGNFYVTSQGGTLHRVTPAGARTTVATGLGSAYGLTQGRDGNFYVSDGIGGRLLRVTPTGTVSVVANGITDARGVTQASDGNFYVTNHNTGVIWKVTPTGTVTTHATGLGRPGEAIQGIDGHLYATDYAGGRLLRVTL